MSEELDYSNVVMVGNGYAKRKESGELGEVFASAQECAGGEPPKPPKLKPAPPKSKSEITGDAKLDAANARADTAEAALLTAKGSDELEDVKSELVSEKARATSAEAAIDKLVGERDSALNELEAADAVIAQQKTELETAYADIEKLKTGSDVELFDVFKKVDGKRADNASKHNITREEVEQFTAKNPNVEYDIVPDAKK